MNSNKKITYYLYTSIFVINFITNAFLLALPEVSLSYPNNTESLEWLALAFFLGMCLSGIVSGRICDSVNLRLYYPFSLVLLSFSFLMAGQTSSFSLFVGLRFIQGILSAFLLIGSNSIITKITPQDSMGKVLSGTITATAISSFLGNSLSRIISTSIGWEWIFYLPIPVLVAISYQFKNINLAIRTTPYKRFNILSITAFFSFLIFSGLWASAIKKHTLEPLVIYSIAAVFSLFFTILVEKNTYKKIFDYSRIFSFIIAKHLLVHLWVWTLVFGVLFITPFFLSNFLNLSGGTSSFFLSAFPLVTIVVSWVLGKFVDKSNGIYLIFAGATIIFSSSLAMSYLTTSSNLFYIFILYAILITGITIVRVQNTKIIIYNSQQDSLGQISGILHLTVTLGSFFGICLAAIFVDVQLDLSANCLKTFNVTCKQFLLGFQNYFLLSAFFTLGLITVNVLQNKFALRPRQNSGV